MAATRRARSAGAQPPSPEALSPEAPSPEALADALLREAGYDILHDDDDDDGSEWSLPGHLRAIPDWALPPTARAPRHARQVRAPRQSKSGAGAAPGGRVVASRGGSAGPVARTVGQRDGGEDIPRTFDDFAAAAQQVDNVLGYYRRARDGAEYAVELLRIYGRNRVGDADQWATPNVRAALRDLADSTRMLCERLRHVEESTMAYLRTTDVPDERESATKTLLPDTCDIAN